MFSHGNSAREPDRKLLWACKEIIFERPKREEGSAPAKLFEKTKKFVRELILVHRSEGNVPERRFSNRRKSSTLKSPDSVSGI
jgi:hypothetical protein